MDGERLLVSDGETRTALAVVRALARRGARVEVLASRPGSLAGASRYSAAEIVVPDPAAQPRSWAEHVRAELERRPGACFLPVTDVACGSALAFGLGDDPRTLAPERAAYAWISDKLALAERAAALGLPVPETLACEGPDALRDALQRRCLPQVARSRRSQRLAGERWQRGVVHYVHDALSLRRACEDPALRDGALVQERIHGRGEGIFLLCERGEVRARFAHRRLREKPPSGGVSVLCESIEPDPTLLAGCEKLLAELGWHGVAMFEFKRTPAGRAYLIEVNPRFWGSLQLAIDAGVDFPALLLDLHRGRPIAGVHARPGVRLRWLLGMVDHLWLLRRRELRAACGCTLRHALRDLATSFADGSRCPVFRWDDLGPFRRELRDWLHV
jgi:hypothetical protein